MISVIKIVGDSMSPTLAHGDYILIKKPHSFRVGFIYVMKHPRLGRIVKRLEKIEDRQLWFYGDNPESTDTEKIGAILPSDIIGRAFLTISPKGLKRL
jgi:nickel-type superoxide dismutase maturation protease